MGTTVSTRQLLSDAYRSCGFRKLAELKDTGSLGTVEVFGRQVGRIMVVTDETTGHTIPVFLGASEVDRLIAALTGSPLEVTP